MFPEDGNVPRGVSRKQVGIITTQAVVRDGHMNRESPREFTPGNGLVSQRELCVKAALTVAGNLSPGIRFIWGKQIYPAH